MTANRVRDFAAYIVISLFFAGACIWFAVYDVDVNWLSLAFETCLLFWLHNRNEQAPVATPGLWLCLVAFMGVHLTIFVLALRQVRQWRAPIVSLIFVIETSAALFLCSVVTSRVEMRRRKEAHPPSRI
jgi:glucan phosphoethanolaminetransferase (alkaline phosphatase superfamily)